MCETCGCGDTKLVPVDVHDRIMSENDRNALHNREHFREQGVLALNLMGSPGSGKTALLEATARARRGTLRLGAVSGDLATDNDATRLRAAGIPSAAITTGSACHLDAELVHRSLHDFPWRELDVFFIENVGNLVCPAIYDLGQEANVVALSVTEGEDKPLKYPVMFRKADLVVLTKVDLLPHVGVSVAAIEDALARVMPKPRMIAVSARTGEGIEAWLAWLEEMRKPFEGRARPTGPAHGHAHADAQDRAHAHGRAHGDDHDHGHGDGHAHAHEREHEDGHAHDHDHDHDRGDHAHGHDSGRDHGHAHAHAPDHDHPHDREAGRASAEARPSEPRARGSRARSRR